MDITSIEPKNNNKAEERKIRLPVFKSPPKILNHYTFTPKTQNIKRAVAGQYIQKSFKRLFWDRPSYTACYGNNEVHIHPSEHRRLTVREAARIQSFPDYWVFQGGLSSEFKQIGNAVPPYLGYAVVKNVLDEISYQNHSAVSLFTGIGGLDIGAESAGLDIKAALEIDKNCIKGLRLNQAIGLRTGIHDFLKQSAIINSDISKKEQTTRKFIESNSNKKIGNIGLVLGGPPCQAFSSAGSRLGLNDERGKLYLGYLNALKEFSPHTFIFENVTGLLQMNKGEILEKITKDFKKLSYNLIVVQLDAVNFSVPQHRNRIFVIGTKDSQQTLDQIKRNLLSIKNKKKVVQDIIRNLPKAKISPKNHNYDEAYYNSRVKWELGDAVFSKKQEDLKTL